MTYICLKSCSKCKPQIKQAVDIVAEDFCLISIIHSLRRVRSRDRTDDVQILWSQFCQLVSVRIKAVTVEPTVLMHQPIELAVPPLGNPGNLLYISGQGALLCFTCFNSSK